jgi:hypothetical protein
VSRAELSPFTPGQPVPTELFVGREHELEELDRRAAAAAQGRLQVAFLSGERGIGKSSIAAFARLLGERRHDLITLQAFMGGASTVEEMVKRVFDRLVKTGQDKTWFDKIRKLFGKHIHNVGLFGIEVGFEPEAGDLQALTQSFDTAIRAIVDKVRGDKAGLFIVLDDINGLARSDSFAHWLKSFVDAVATSGEPLPLFLVLVGLEERRRELIHLQPSLARLFDLIDIKPWPEIETMAFYQRAFESVDIAVDESALAFMSKYAGGLPVLAHEIGDAAFHIDSDSRISNGDAALAVISAADVVGRKHVAPQVFEAIRSKRYRAILQKIPQNLGEAFKRSDVKEHLSAEEGKVLDNFLRKMCSLGVLSKDSSEGPGAYRFTSSLHFLYFQFEAERSRSRESAQD